MSWLDRVVRPRVRALVRRNNIPENQWEKCPECGQMIFHRDHEAAAFVCPHCGFHMRLAPRRRLEMLFDDGAFQEIELPKVPADPLKFRDRRRYIDRLREAREKSGQVDALVVAHGRLGGAPAVIAAFNFDFLGGSMGSAVGEGLIAAARLAVLQEAAFIVIPASGGARMQEGVISLVQMARTTVAVDEVKEAGLPYIVVLTNPTTGGVTASFAMLGDIAIAEPGAVIGFAGARVIEETIREKLPEGFQRAEYLLAHGMIDMVVPRKELRETLVRIVRLLMAARPAAKVVELPQSGLEARPRPAEAEAAGAEDASPGE